MGERRTTVVSSKTGPNGWGEFGVSWDTAKRVRWDVASADLASGWSGGESPPWYEFNAEHASVGFKIGCLLALINPIKGSRTILTTSFGPSSTRNAFTFVRPSEVRRYLDRFSVVFSVLSACLPGSHETLAFRLLPSDVLGLRPRAFRLLRSAGPFAFGGVEFRHFGT